MIARAVFEATAALEQYLCASVSQDLLPVCVHEVADPSRGELAGSSGLAEWNGNVLQKR
jgi:hypothetical protein